MRVCGVWLDSRANRGVGRWVRVGGGRVGGGVMGLKRFAGCVEVGRDWCEFLGAAQVWGGTPCEW